MPGPDRGPIIVMKFGGTSVADAAGRRALVHRVQSAIDADSRPVLVVSAMGRDGAPYATDTLLGLVKDLPADARELDMLAACGETISAVLIAHELRDAGVIAAAFTGAEAGIGTDGTYGSAEITEIQPRKLLAAIALGVVRVVCGFQGVEARGHVTTLGRGGSDTTACALGVALGAESVEIYTDVDGVMTADPNACDGVAVLRTIGAEELFQMARHGSRVVHTPAAELALSSGIQMRVRNTFTDADGTLVCDLAAAHPREVATAVTQASAIARVRVALPEPEGSTEHMAVQTLVYRTMAEECISLDMFTPAGNALLFTVDEDATEMVSGVLARLGLPHQIDSGFAKVTLVGAGMHGVPGVMARVAEHLSAADISVLQTADSHTTISVLVRAGQAEAAVQALHDGFELNGELSTPR